MTEHQTQEAACIEWLTARVRKRLDPVLVGLTADDRTELIASTQRILESWRQALGSPNG